MTRFLTNSQKLSYTCIWELWTETQPIDSVHVHLLTKLPPRSANRDSNIKGHGPSDSTRGGSTTTRRPTVYHMPRRRTGSSRNLNELYARRSSGICARNTVENLAESRRNRTTCYLAVLEPQPSALPVLYFFRPVDAHLTWLIKGSRTSCCTWIAGVGHSFVKMRRSAHDLLAGMPTCCVPTTFP